MNITSNITQPSFKARLKQNDTLKVLERSMTENEHKDYKKLLNKLEKVSPGDVLEIYAKDDPKNSYEAPYTEYFIRNTKKENSDMKIIGGYNCKRYVPPKNFIKTLSNVIKHGTNESYKLLTKPSTEDQRSLGERISDIFFSKNNDEPFLDPFDFC